MTGPIARVMCPDCGLLYARRRDGLPYAHRCADGVPLFVICPICRRRRGRPAPDVRLYCARGHAIAAMQPPTGGGRRRG